VDEYVFGPHDWHVLALVALTVADHFPGSQGMHVASDTACTVPEYLPATHEVHVDESLAAHVPATHPVAVTFVSPTPVTVTCPSV
jgi:hypothetical protein